MRTVSWVAGAIVGLVAAALVLGFMLSIAVPQTLCTVTVTTDCFSGTAFQAGLQQGVYILTVNLFLALTVGCVTIIIIEYSVDSYEAHLRRIMREECGKKEGT
jgi:hypothetical protein